MMKSRTILRAQAGVRLDLVERLAQRQRDVTFRLSSYRDGSQLLITDEEEAHRAFALEVAASLQDPVVLGLIERGVLEN